MRILFLIVLSISLSACSRHYSVADAATRASGDLTFPFGIELPRDAQVLHGYRFGGRDRGDAFLVKMSPGSVRSLKAQLDTLFAPSKSFAYSFGKDISTAPFAFDRPDQVYSILKGATWWQPWTLTDPHVVSLVKLPFARSRLWLAFSERSGLLYVVAHNN
jgi:hypothetical protein